MSLAAGQLNSPSPPNIPSTVLAAAQIASGPSSPPLAIANGKEAGWWFAYKFSASSFPGRKDDPLRECPFGGTRRGQSFSQRYVYATRDNPTLSDGPGLIGTSTGDPLGATFGKIYDGNYFYVVWNDQFKGDPVVKGVDCKATECEAPWGHSKGILAWDKDGNGLIIQVTTPSWPGSGSARQSRGAGNTLGCISNDNDVSNAQDFFALQLSRSDVTEVLHALALASVSTDINDPKLVNRTVKGASPLQDLDAIVATLGRQVSDRVASQVMLSSGVELISKPSALHVPPWQFVSSMLGGEGLRTATWWATPRMPSTRGAADVHCWDSSLKTAPGEVDVARSGTYEGKPVAFTGGPNHAKIGVSLNGGGNHYAIFGDLNQQGTVGIPGASYAACGSGQNGRGGLFFVVQNAGLAQGISNLIAGETAPYPQ